MSTVIITMAGSGTRFQMAGFTLPKFMLEARGRTLFAWSMESLRNFFDFHFIFISLASHNADTFIEQECRILGIKSFEVIAIESLTEGQASTVLCAEGRVAGQEPIIIYNIDTCVAPTCLSPAEIRGEGWIPCFSCEGHHFSFARMDSDGRVLEVAEKRRISPWGTIGLYYFSSMDLFRSCYEKCSFAGVREKFVAPLYQVLLDEQRPVFASQIPAEAVSVLGTPEEVRAFDPSFTPPVLSPSSQ